MNDSGYDLEGTPTESLQSDLQLLSRQRITASNDRSEVGRRRRADIDVDIREILEELGRRSDGTMTTEE